MKGNNLFGLLVLALMVSACIGDFESAEDQRAAIDKAAAQADLAGGDLGTFDGGSTDASTIPEVSPDTADTVDATEGVDTSDASDTDAAYADEVSQPDSDMNDSDTDVDVSDADAADADAMEDDLVLPDAATQDTDMLDSDDDAGTDIATDDGQPDSIEDQEVAPDVPDAPDALDVSDTSDTEEVQQPLDVPDVPDVPDVFDSGATDAAVDTQDAAQDAATDTSPDVPVDAGADITTTKPDVEEPVCKTSCDDGNACTTDYCAFGACYNDPLTGTACDVVGQCTTNDVCKAGTCTMGTVTDCGDGNPCTDDICIPSKGCVSIPAADGVSCSDGVPCTEGDACKAGKCAGSVKTCNDNNPCTADSCGTDGVCVFAAVKPAASYTFEDGVIPAEWKTSPAEKWFPTKQDKIEGVFSLGVVLLKSLTAEAQLTLPKAQQYLVRWKWRRNQITTDKQFQMFVEVRDASGTPVTVQSSKGPTTKIIHPGDNKVVLTEEITVGTQAVTLVLGIMTGETNAGEASTFDNIEVWTDLPQGCAPQ